MSEEPLPEPAEQDGEKDAEKTTLWSRLPSWSQYLIACGLFFGGVQVLSATLHYFNPNVPTNRDGGLNSIFNNTATVPLPDCLMVQKNTFTAANGKTYTIACKP